MRSESKPVRCGCGGEGVVRKGQTTECWWVECSKCEISTMWKLRYSESEAIEAWNTAMGERTAKVVCHGTTMGLSFCCGNCGKPVHSEGKYCHHCGAKLDWSGHE